MEEYFNNLSEEEKSNMRVKRYDYDANYEKWKKIKDRFSIRQYLFGSFYSRFDERVEVLLFVNIEETLKTLLKYYEDFRRSLEYDFDPWQVIFDVENKESKFWKTVMHSYALQGILLGFGRENAWFFEWESHKNTGIKSEKFLTSLVKTFSDDEDIENYGPQNFLLPVFVKYGRHPKKKLVEKYTRERKQIKAIYKGKDEVDVALDWLTR